MDKNRGLGRFLELFIAEDHTLPFVSRNVGTTTTTVSLTVLRHCIV